MIVSVLSSSSLWQLAKEMCEFLLSSSAFAETRGQLLDILDQAAFSREYSHYCRAYYLLQQIPPDQQKAQKVNVHNFRLPAAELLSILLSCKMFNQARDWVAFSGVFGAEAIVLEQVRLSGGPISVVLVLMCDTSGCYHIGGCCEKNHSL